tara:strand:- start:1238 stop:3127 length:1890 start_codon:yes stop_codon:yes gene_type:complete
MFTRFRAIAMKGTLRNLLTAISILMFYPSSCRSSLPILLCAITSISGWAQSTYYVSPNGSDEALGTAPNSAWQTLAKLNEQTFAPGDEILFERGGHWLGMFHLKGSGSQSQPIVLGDFGASDQPMPTIDGDGFQSALLIYNDSFITVENLIFTNQASHLDANGVVKKLPSFLGESNDWGSGKNVRFGIKVVADATPLEGIVIRDIVIHDVFPTPTNPENKHLGYGIKLENRSDTLAGNVNTIDDVVIENAKVTRTGHYGLWIKALGLAGNNSIKNNNIHVKGCTFSHTGGSGFVPNRCRDVVVEHCVFNHTGSSIDERMWKRGSGTWSFKCERVFIQNNRLMNAHGPQDSYSAHIDYGNKDVIIQYNLSFNNEGGFAEVLGDNINCGYRYNISINDGYREDPEGLPWNKKGKIFWVSTFCGGAVRCPSVGTFFYNNTVYVDSTLNPEIYVWPEAGDVHILNNLICLAPDGETLQSFLENQDNQYSIGTNLFYPASRIELDEDLTEGALLVDPVFVSNSATIPLQSALNFQLQNSSPALQSGTLISGSANTLDFLENNGGRDFFGQPVSNTLLPSIGALQSSLCGTNSHWSSSEAMCLPINDACFGDLDNDGSLSVMDLLILLSLLSITC